MLIPPAPTCQSLKEGLYHMYEQKNNAKFPLSVIRVDKTLSNIINTWCNEIRYLCLKYKEQKINVTVPSFILWKRTQNH